MLIKKQFSGAEFDPKTEEKKKKKKIVIQKKCVELPR